jgi:DNA-binding winged helix-turn-helix (wHTH) protein
METKAYEFDDFRVNLADCTLLQRGTLIALTPKAFDTLRLLVENRERLLDKDEMMQRLWPDTHVDEANLANNISILRKALGSSGVRIQTVPRRGYRFTGEVQEVGDETPPATVLSPAKPRWRLPVLALGLVAAGIAAGAAIGRRAAHREPARFTQVTFRRGVFFGARYLSDGETILYRAAHEGRPPELFLTRADQHESKALGVPAEALLSVSRLGQIAILTKAEWLAWIPRGTLALTPITGGAPREILDDVQDADFSPDGKTLAVVHWDGSDVKVEYPIGKVLYRASRPVWISSLRISPDGEEVAFLLHESERFDDRGRAMVLDRAGGIRLSSRVFTSAYGLVWARDGRGLWISASSDGLNNALHAIDRKGRDRMLAGTAGRLLLCDTNARGRALAILEESRIGMIVRAPREAAEREFSWLDGSWVRDISHDGNTVLFDEENTGGGRTGRVYVRNVDGSPAVNLGPGNAIALSHDGRWALARQRFTKPPRFVLIPTGAGAAHVLQTGAIEPTERAAWLPDGRGFVFVGAEPGRRPRTYLFDLASAKSRAVTPEGVTGTAVTADGSRLAARPRGQVAALYRLDAMGGAPEPILGLTRDVVVARFGSDGRSLFTTTEGAVHRLDLTSGNDETLWTVGAAQPQGVLFATPPIVAADGSAYAYTYASESSTIFAVDGLE